MSVNKVFFLIYLVFVLDYINKILMNSRFTLEHRYNVEYIVKSRHSNATVRKCSDAYPMLRKKLTILTPMMSGKAGWRLLRRSGQNFNIVRACVRRRFEGKNVNSLNLRRRSRRT